MPGLHFLTHRTEGEAVVLAFTVPLLNAEAIAEAVTVIDAAGHRTAILDCQSIRCLVSGSLYPDQEPLKPLLMLNRKLNAAGGRLVLCNLTPEFAELLRVTRLDQIYEVQPTIAAAVACLKAP